MVVRSDVRNKILGNFSDEDFEYILPLLEKAELRLHDKLTRPHVPISHVYFPVSGLLSVVIGGETCVEVGLIGREGMTDMVILPGDRTPLTILVQIAGEAWRVRAEDYAMAQIARPNLRVLSLRFQQWMTVQASYAALSHATSRIPQRLARWLLMAQDRIEEDQLPLVHQFLSTMLAVRRSGVTEALHQLEGKGAIKTSRARITIQDRTQLEKLAGETYGAAEAEYQRLIAH
jgi:CRP-like cAMP-binding protein